MRKGRMEQSVEHQRTDKQAARRRVRELLESSEQAGNASREAELLTEAVRLCAQHGLTQHDCLIARERLRGLVAEVNRIGRAAGSKQ